MGWSLTCWHFSAFIRADIYCLIIGLFIIWIINRDSKCEIRGGCCVNGKVVISASQCFLSLQHIPVRLTVFQPIFISISSFMDYVSSVYLF